MEWMDRSYFILNLSTVMRLFFKKLWGVFQRHNRHERHFDCVVMKAIPDILCKRNEIEDFHFTVDDGIRGTIQTLELL